MNDRQVGEGNCRRERKKNIGGKGRREKSMNAVGGRRMSPAFRARHRWAFPIRIITQRRRKDVYYVITCVLAQC